MTTAETIVNLWYYVNEERKFIFALAGRAYIAAGTDEDKTALLKQLAATDYPLAIRRQVPDRYVADYAGKMSLGVVPVSELDDPATQLFEEVYRDIDADLAKMAESQNQPVDDFMIPDNPLFVMTALYLDDYGTTHVLGRNPIPVAGVS